MKIFINPGHGGSDPGAFAHNTKEKDINLIVALKLKDLLLLNGFEVLMSRETDNGMELSDIASMANAWGADLFVSVHHNAGGGDGFEVIHSFYMGIGKKLADLIGAEFRLLGQNYRNIYARKGTYGDYYAVIRETNMPAIITEYAFMDTVDFEAIDTTVELYNEAAAIAKAVCKYAGISYTEVVPHWAQPYFDFLKADGLDIEQTRFDETMTRGEVFKLIALALGYTG